MHLSRFAKNLSKFCDISYFEFIQMRSYSCDGGQKSASKGVVIGLYKKTADEEPRLTSSGETFNEKAGGKLSDLIKECGMNGVLGKGKVFNNIDNDYSSVAVVGLGREGAGFNELEMLDEGMENVRVAAGVGVRSLQMLGIQNIDIDGMEYPEQAAEGGVLAAWSYNDLAGKMNKVPIPTVNLFGSSDTDGWTRGLFKAEAQNLARRLSEGPANIMTPTGFAQEACDALCPCGLTVEIRLMDWIEAAGLNSLLAIAKGSCEPPVVLELMYCGTEPGDKPVVLLGKGITFNSGGINLRECKGMDEYRASMSGAAVVLACMRAAATLSLPMNITAIIPLCENMPSGMSSKPGDVVTLLNGRSMAIRDLDKAGVCVMADPLIYAQNTYHPRLVVDVATLGMGVKKAFGGGAAGIFSNSHYIFKQFLRAGSLTGDRVWRLPLWNYYKKLVTESLSFDVTNNGIGPASSCLAAAVLHELVPCVDWAHLDTRGVGMLTKSGAVPYLRSNRMTGRPTRTIVQFLYQIACPDGK